jgi:Tol biopolymer transport system component
VLPADTEVVTTNMAPLAMAPDGRTIAFSGIRAGRTQLFINDLSTGETKPLDGTDDARTPFFSPDGRWIGFFARGKLKKIAVGGTSLGKSPMLPTREVAPGPRMKSFITLRRTHRGCGRSPLLAGRRRSS